MRQKWVCESVQCVPVVTSVVMCICLTDKFPVDLNVPAIVTVQLLHFITV